MIRIILIDGQVCEGTKAFSFWTTICDRYLEFNGEQMWENKEDFVYDFNKELNNPYKNELNRFIEKIPNKYE